MNRFRLDVCNELGTSGEVGVLSFSGGFFYKRPARRIMSGFLLDSTPFASYIWCGALPICDKLAFPHLTFGNRLNIRLEQRPSASEFVEIIKPVLEDTLALSDPSKFVDKFSDRVDAGYSGRSFAAVLAALGEFGRAKAQLELCLADGGRKVGGYYDDTAQLMQAVSAESDAVVSRVLDEWEAATKAKYGIY